LPIKNPRADGKTDQEFVWRSETAQDGRDESILASRLAMETSAG
jgi:hypothetical protein